MAKIAIRPNGQHEAVDGEIDPTTLLRYLGTNAQIATVIGEVEDAPFFYNGERAIMIGSLPQAFGTSFGADFNKEANQIKYDFSAQNPNAGEFGPIESMPKIYGTVVIVTEADAENYKKMK